MRHFNVFKKITLVGKNSTKKMWVVKSLFCTQNNLKYFKIKYIYNFIPYTRRKKFVKYIAQKDLHFT